MKGEEEQKENTKQKTNTNIALEYSNEQGKDNTKDRGEVG